MRIKASSLSSLPTIAQALLKFADEEKVFLFEGEMAAGKTTFIKSICTILGVTEPVSSPTYAIVNEYQGKSEKIFHFDFYRIKNEDEAFDIGFEEYLYSGATCLIEWPEKISGLLPSHFIKVKIEIGDNQERMFAFEKH